MTLHVTGYPPQHCSVCKIILLILSQAKTDLRMPGFCLYGCILYVRGAPCILQWATPTVHITFKSKAAQHSLQCIQTNMSSMSPVPSKFQKWSESIHLMPYWSFWHHVTTDGQGRASANIATVQLQVTGTSQLCFKSFLELWNHKEIMYNKCTT